jgi:hypothetical protein
MHAAVVVVTDGSPDAQATRLKHPSHNDVLFSKPLDLIRTHCLPYAVQESYKQMESLVYYQAECLHLPRAFGSWVSRSSPFVLLV